MSCENSLRLFIIKSKEPRAAVASVLGNGTYFSLLDSFPCFLLPSSAFRFFRSVSVFLAVYSLKINDKLSAVCLDTPRSALRAPLHLVYMSEMRSALPLPQPRLNLTTALSLSLSFSQSLSLFLPPSATLTPFSISCANQQCPAAITIADLTARTRKYNKYFCSLMAVFMKAITVFYRACNRTRPGGGIFNSY